MCSRTSLQCSHSFKRKVLKVLKVDVTLVGLVEEWEDHRAQERIARDERAKSTSPSSAVTKRLSAGGLHRIARYLRPR